jgi:geranylgeranyl diphosphate synthase, type II
MGTSSTTVRKQALNSATRMPLTSTEIISGESRDVPVKSRRQTSHLKIVPETKELREQIRARATEVAAKLNKEVPLTKDQMEAVTRRLLEELGLHEGYVGWTMVVLSGEFWKDAVAAVPPSRRLFLLPHCLKHAEGCPADYDEFGMNCKKCGACSIADFRSIAEEMGYKVLVAEGSPVVMKIIVSGYVDAIVGVACLNVLEKAIDKILLSGIPCMAVPLLSSDCRNTSVDEDWVSQMVMTKQTAPVQQTRSYVHLMRTAAEMFSPAGIDRLVKRARSTTPLSELAAPGELEKLDPIAATEAIACDFLARGGKYSRPFITLAAYDALTSDQATLQDGALHAEQISDAVKRAAMSIEAFHKASLVHDDIEDGDDYRYGEPAMHRRWGEATAINVGDYLIGLGYRLVSREVASLGADAVSDILECLAQAHMRLSEGQGAELLWRDARDKRLEPLDALKIYALKTAPAFEAALYTGVRLAGDATSLSEAIRGFSRNIGVAFQILNDLGDWQGDDHNKMSAGGDVLGGRPTVLWALALAGLEAADQEELLSLARADCSLTNEQKIRRVGQLFRKAKVFEQANRLVDKHHQRAEEIASGIENSSLRRLLLYLLDTVLHRSEESAPAAVVVLPTPMRSVQPQ